MKTEPNANNPPPAPPQDAASEPVQDAQADPTDFSAIQSDLEKFRDLAMRTQADFENYRKRAARERDDAVRYANLKLLEDLLPVLDNFELGLAAARREDPSSPIVQGMGMVEKQLSDFLAAQGAQPVSADPGTPFDPSQHEALGHEDSPNFPEGSVIRQLRKGYKLRDRLLRAASVFVSRGSGQSSDSGAS